MKKIVSAIILMMALTACSNITTKPVNTDEKLNPTVDNQESDSEVVSNLKNDDINNSSIDSSLINNIDTTNSLFEKGNYDYQGTINGNIGIQMSIFKVGDYIIGSYFYNNNRIEIKVKGKAGATEFVLYEYNDLEEVTGIFSGTMNTIDKIEGTWSSSDGNQSYPFILTLRSSALGTEYGKRYAVAIGEESDQNVENFVSEIQEAIKNDNIDLVAQKVNYPIDVNVDGVVLKINNKEEFINNYNKIINSNFKDVISNAYTNYLFANYTGIMFGENQFNIWINKIDSKLVITSINN